MYMLDHLRLELNETSCYVCFTCLAFLSSVVSPLIAAAISINWGFAWGRGVCVYFDCQCILIGAYYNVIIANLQFVSTPSPTMFLLCGCFINHYLLRFRIKQRRFQTLFSKRFEE